MVEAQQKSLSRFPYFTSSCFSLILQNFIATTNNKNTIFKKPHKLDSMQGLIQLAFFQLMILLYLLLILYNWCPIWDCFWSFCFFLQQSTLCESTHRINALEWSCCVNSLSLGFSQILQILLNFPSTNCIALPPIYIGGLSWWLRW